VPRSWPEARWSWTVSSLVRYFLSGPGRFDRFALSSRNSDGRTCSCDRRNFETRGFGVGNHCYASGFQPLSGSWRCVLYGSVLGIRGVLWPLQYYQKKTGTFLHRLTASPTDMTLVYRCWLAYSELSTGSELDDDFPSDLTEMFFLVSCAATLLARYSLVSSWLAFVLPGAPHVLDKTGRIKRSILGCIFSINQGRDCRFAKQNGVSDCRVFLPEPISLGSC